MPQREKKQPTQISAFKYLSVAECEENEDYHIVQPTTWPPQRVVRNNEEASLSLRCILCDGHLVVYAGHASGKLGGVYVDTSKVKPVPTAPAKPKALLQEKQPA